MQDVAGLRTTGALDALASARLRAVTDTTKGAPQSAAKRFEALLATQLVKEMRRSLDEGFFGNGPGSDVFEGWLDEHLGEALTRGRGLGLADSIAHDLGEKAAGGEAKP
jgi:Rod binding domain-containing protein